MKLVCFFFFLIIFFSCSTGAKDDTSSVATPSVSSKDSSLAKGIVIAKINCKTDSAINYALYISKKYLINEKLPVIFFFDSHGSGTFPIEKYKDLAEKYGYILAGSNNSKNGMSWEQNYPQIKIFMNDVKERLSVDERRIYTCGFSGGSRVASSIAIFDGGINCVIGMGAGFPSLNEPIHNRFDFIGFAGNEDFNMNELIQLSGSMDNTPIRHQLIVFNGKHEWAPDFIAEDAFAWCDLNAIKDGFISKNDSMIKNYIVNEKKILINCERDKELYKAFLLCKKVTNFFDGLADVSEFKTKADELLNSDAMKKILLKNEKLSSEEMVSQETYRNNFLLKDLTWWTSEIKKINREAKNKNDADRAAMNKRLLSYLSLLAYMNCSSDIQQKQYDLLETHVKIYEMAEPSNSEHQYMFAELYGVKKDNAKVFAFLGRAVMMGFNDILRMESDPLLSDFKQTEEYKKIIQGIKTDFPI